jgi:hypothetical protein
MSFGGTISGFQLGDEIDPRGLASLRAAWGGKIAMAPHGPSDGGRVAAP